MPAFSPELPDSHPGGAIRNTSPGRIIRAEKRKYHARSSNYVYHV